MNKGKWRAQIVKDGKNYHLGAFATPEEAHRAYMEAASAAFGEYACSGTAVEQKR